MAGASSALAETTALVACKDGQMIALELHLELKNSDLPGHPMVFWRLVSSATDCRTNCLRSGGTDIDHVLEIGEGLLEICLPRVVSVNQG